MPILFHQALPKPTRHSDSPTVVMVLNILLHHHHKPQLLSSARDAWEVQLLGPTTELLPQSFWGGTWAVCVSGKLRGGTDRHPEHRTVP